MKITLRQLNKVEITPLEYNDIEVDSVFVNLNHKYTIKDDDGNFLYGQYISCVPTGLEIPIPTENARFITTLVEEINKFINDESKTKISCSINTLEELTFEK